MPLIANIHNSTEANYSSMKLLQTAGQGDHGTLQQTFAYLNLRIPPLYRHANPILPGVGLPKPNPVGSGTLQIKSTKVCCRVPWVSHTVLIQNSPICE